MSQSEPIFLFSKVIPDVGTIRLRHLNLAEDIPTIYNWVSKEYAKFWGMQNKTPNEVKEEYQRIMAHSEVFVGLCNGEKAFLLERYRPVNDLIGKYYDAQDEDCGIHLIVAPADVAISGFTFIIFTAIMDFIFSDKHVRRIVVEPDIRNEKMFVLCKRVGFECGQVLLLPHKTARIAFCTREKFLEKKELLSINKKNMDLQTLLPGQAVGHLKPELWLKVNCLLIKKAICEFTHELLLMPQLQEKKNDWNSYILHADEPYIRYHFRARPLALNHLYIDPHSIEKFINNKPVVLDAVLFIKEFKSALGIDPNLLPSYLEEIISTLSGSAYKHMKGNPKAQELATADFQTIEQSMMEGHPGFVANNGRIGFDAADYRAYAPEAGNPFSLIWLAGHKDRTVYAGIKELSYTKLIEQELGEATIQSFNEIIAGKGLDPENYFFIPVHPWQWFNKVATVFAPEIAAGRLVCLGYSPDCYLAQQSIRTLFNITHPYKFYTKTSLSILNMGFMRGLPVYYLGTAPEMAEWLENLLANDPYIKETGFAMLGEIASVSYINPYYEAFGKHHPYNKMLASLWRESPVSMIRPGQRLMTMAALLHVDHEGSALLPELIKVSGLTTDHWLQHYLKAYLSPLLHCFYTYDLVFMPHGENLILVLEDGVPVKTFMKDITEEAVILDPDIPLPENISRMYVKVPDDLKLLSIFIDVFDGFFRFLSHILVEHADYPEKLFWEQVAACISSYQEQHPHLEGKFNHYDLFAADFQLSCLNRLQLNNNNTMINLDDPVALLQFKGKLKNPLAAFKKQNRYAGVQ